ncbi:MAG: hypothetical protein V7L05_13220 [Nostoc sp.]|uniref:hypothetical protein n=1 Tax=Nostoc sp. TaxID=1180 RepID=UPI002FF9C7AA
MSTFTVTNTNNSGAGSLRQQILNADLAGGTNIINFGGLFSDAIAHTINLTGSGLSITDNLTIQGTNPNLLTVKDDSATRVFDIASGATATINGLTITNSYKGTGGGAISNEGVFTLNNSIITGNTAETGSTNYGFGGGGGIFNDGTLTVNYSTLNNNTAESGSSSVADANGGGGGIFNNGTLTVNHSTLNNNTAEAGSSYENGGGGGIYNDGTLTVNYSTLSNNKTGTNSDYYSGGGINSDSGGLVVNNSNITGNTTSGNGGGIFSSSFVLNNSNITGNTAAYGGGIASGQFLNDEIITVNYSNITGNSATLDGGGIYNRGKTLLVSKSTITGNSATSDGGGIDGINGYFYAVGGPIGVVFHDMLILGNINVSNSTISDNQAHFGAGIYNDGNLTVGNSTIKHNKAFGIELSSSNYKSGEGGGIYHNSTDYATSTVDYSTIACNFDTPEEDSNKFIKLDNLVGKFITKGSFVRV